MTTLIRIYKGPGEVCDDQLHPELGLDTCNKRTNTLPFKQRHLSLGLIGELKRKRSVEEDRAAHTQWTNDVHIC